MKPLTVSELIAGRQQLGYTPDQMAAELHVPPHVYAAWESGSLAVPKEKAQWFRVHVDADGRQKALTASGIPECKWMQDVADPDPQDIDDIDEFVAQLAAHEKTCATCQARKAVLDKFGEPPEMPMPLWVRVIQSITHFADRFPPWARPAVWGALFMGTLAIIRVIVLLPSAFSNPRALLVALGAFVAASAAGAIGGLTYGFVGRPLKRVRVIGPHLAGIVAAIGYLLPLLLVLEEEMRSLDGLFAFGITAVIFGAIFGHVALRDKRKPAKQRVSAA